MNEDDFYRRGADRGVDPVIFRANDVSLFACLFPFLSLVLFHDLPSRAHAVAPFVYRDRPRQTGCGVGDASLPLLPEKSK